jgi:hypothetical protein
MANWSADEKIGLSLNQNWITHGQLWLTTCVSLLQPMKIHLELYKEIPYVPFFNHILSFALILSYSSFFLLLYYDDFILKRPHNHYNGICAVDRSNGCCKWSTSEELDITLTLEALQFMCIIWNFENSFEVVLSTL